VLFETLTACANSIVHPPADFKLTGEVGVLIVYESKKKDIFVGKVGSIQFKQKVDGKFQSFIEDSSPLSAKPDTHIMVRFYPY